MKKLLLAALLFAGCTNAALVRGVDAGVSQISPEYRRYVESDPTLEPTTKEIRLRTLTALEELIAKAKADL